MKCIDCKFFQRQEKQEGGWCHRYPPQLIYDSDDDETYSWFPYVALEEWCGEFQQKLRISMEDWDKERLLGTEIENTEKDA